MNAGAGLDIQLIDKSGRPLDIDRVSVEIVMFTNGRERYRFDVGVTGPDGKLSVSYSKLNSIRRGNQALALMDYNTELEDCDDEILVRIPQLDEMQKRLDAGQKWFPDQAEDLKSMILSSNNGVLLPVDKRVVIRPSEWNRIVVTTSRR